VPFLSGHTRPRRGSDSHMWRGGRFTDKYGYVQVYAPGHADADQKGYVRENRLVMEQILGRPLLSTEHVHHKNEIKSDNSEGNLMVLTQAEHNALHAPSRRYDKATMRAAGLRGAAARWGEDSRMNARIVRLAGIEGQLSFLRGAERAVRIMELLEASWTMEAIGLVCGISVARVSQIVAGQRS